MIRKFVIRNLIKRPFLNLIKVTGLSLSLISILLILLFLKIELSYDRFHKESARIYRFTVTDDSFIAGKHFARVSNAGYIPAMALYFPEIENYVRLAPIRGGVMKYNEEYISITQAFECDSTFFRVFDAGLLTGNPVTILNDPGSMVISESFAERVFGKNDPVGQVLILPAGQFYGREISFTIRGIMKDFPHSSHFHPELITSPVDKSIFDGWAWTYLLLSGNADPGKILSGYREFYTTHVENGSGGEQQEAHLQKITAIHLHSNKLREIENNGNLSVIYALSLAALILLLIALANYANLNIGMAGFSDKFLFVNKVTGSSGLIILKYFFYEGIVIILAATVVGGLIAVPANRHIQEIYGINLFSGNLAFILSFMALFALLGILSGMMPLLKQGVARVTSTKDHDGNGSFKRKGISKSIILVQYTISIALIVAALVIHRQTRYALENSMGFNNENLVCVEDVHTSVQNKFELFKSELLKYNSIASVSAMFEPPGGEANDMFRFTLEGYTKNNDEDDGFIGIFPCDHSFAGIFKLKFMAGSNFSAENEENEGSGEYIINETAMRRLHYADPEQIIGKAFKLNTNIVDVNIPDGRIIGVVKDFHLSSLKKEIEPLVLFKRKNLWLINFVISFQPGMTSKALADMQAVWENLFPGYQLEYRYVSAMYERVYKTELLQARLLSLFTGIALIICSMGMLGLTLLTTQRRIKEIGIRKINGAATDGIMVMLCWDMLKLVLMSFLLAIPLALFFMHKWMENFAYKIPLSWWIFALAGLTAILVTLVTVSVHAWRASNRKPVEALRYE